MPYTSKSGSGYGSQRRKGYSFSGKSIAEIQNSRSLQSKLLDARLKAPLAKSVEEWAEKPNRLDLPDVDAPKEPLPAKISQALKADIKDENAAGPDYVEVAKQLETAGFVEEAQKVDAIAAQEGQHKEILKDIVERKPDVEAVKIEPPKGSVEGSSATINKATGWMALSFSSIPPVDVRQEMKSNGFRYNPVRKQWVGKWYPFREEMAKKFAGSVEEVNIEPNWAAKAEHASEMAAKHQSISNETYARKQKLQTMMSDEPIHVGHHSERHHRADQERLGNLLTKTIEEQKIAEKYAARAARYGEKATGENPGLIYRRIQKLEAEERKMKRRLEDPDYTRTESDRTHFQKWLNHYQQRLSVEREKYKASGGLPVKDLSLKPGDRVKTKHGMGTLASVSKKSVRVKLDPMDNGRERWIYANSKGESLLSIDDITGKL